MNKITKKTAFGAITATGAAALLVGGFAAPAMAADTTDVTSDSSTTSSATDLTGHLTSSLSDLFRVGDVSNSSPLVLAPEVGVGDVVGDIGVGDIGSGNAIGSGNDTTAPVLSGNETSAGNGNDTSAGNGNGNGSGNGNASGNESSNDVSDVVDNVTDSDVSDVVDNVTDTSVKDIVKDVTDSIDVGDITDDLDLGLDNILGD